MSGSQYLPVNQSLHSQVTPRSSYVEEDYYTLRKGFDPEWVEINSQPKRWYYPKEKREATPWQKPGPMARQDWVRFYQWASKNAVPRIPPKPKNEYIKPTIKKRKKKFKNIDETLEHLNKLSQPKKTREKYKFPEEKDFSYSPKTNSKDSAHRKPRRPLKKPEIPMCFYHIDIENEFWSTLRFPVDPRARNYKATPRIQKLAQPRPTYIGSQYYQLLNSKCEGKPVRTKMTQRQWIEHMHRLEYLTKPQYQNDQIYNMYLDQCRYC